MEMGNHTRCVPPTEEEIERYSLDIWDALHIMHYRYGKLNTTLTMLCSKCGNPEPSSERLDSPCTECCEDLSMEQVMRDPKFNCWKEAKKELKKILEDMKNIHLPFKKSVEDRYTQQLMTVVLEYPQGTRSWMQLDYMRFLKNYCPSALMDIIVNFRHHGEYVYIFYKRLFVKYMDSDVHQEAKRMLILNDPLQMYPRQIKYYSRKITFHVGPTNSGTTIEALKSFKAEGKSAIYCAPLPLLAMKVYQDVNKEGIVCDLQTGENIKHHSGSVKCSCAVELVDLSKKWEVGVIDENQMIGDDFRGGAWTRAFLGLNAEEIHLCGQSSVVELIQQLCQITGDRLKMVERHRRSQLIVEDEALVLGESEIESGDCFIGFSVRRLKEIKRTILQQQPEVKCTLLYPCLPPELIIEAAEKFLKDSESHKAVLLATDAIAMGFDLPIRRVIFTETEKCDNHELSKRPVKIELMKQIAGRAGRGSENGYCTATNTESLEYLKKCLEAPTESIKESVLDLDPRTLPILGHLWRKLGKFKDWTFVRFIEDGHTKGRVDDRRTGCFRFRKFQSEFLNLAYRIAHKELMPRITLSDFFKLCNCPCEDPLIVVSWMTDMFCRFTECSFNYLNGAFDYNVNEYTFEGVYSLIRAYKYLYNQFPQNRSLMIHYDRLPELELQIKTIIQQREKKEEEYWLRYPNKTI